MNDNTSSILWGDHTLANSITQETPYDMQPEDLQRLVIDALEDMKARDIEVIDVRGKTSITDIMIIASGTSDTHVRALAERVITCAKEAGILPLGTEGLREGEWALVDLNDLVLHIMLPWVRDYYQLERLWGAASPPAEIVARR